jgi:dihydrodipicolinate synthase/N-acetylneuraminate lyase
VDLEAHSENVSTLTAQGCSGFVIGGSTGEGPYLDPGERGALVASTRKAAPGSSIVCGINGESVLQAQRQITEIADAGADVALVATPTTLIRGIHDLVGDFYRQVADASPIPVLLYSNPSVVAYEIPTALLTALSTHSNIIGVKDSGGNPKRFDDLRDAIDKGFAVFSGSSGTLLESAERGAQGAVTASGNYAFSLVSGAISGDAAAQAELASLTTVIEPHGRAGTKYAASVSGLTAGRLRPPLAPLDAAAVAKIDAVLDSRKHPQPE